MFTIFLNSPSFGYSHPLKTAFLKGLTPEVKFGIYKKPIDKRNVSIEHITPKSKGGKLSFDNIFLADKFENSKRGIRPIEEIINKFDIFDYLQQWLNVKNQYVDGIRYIKGILQRFNLKYQEFISYISNKRG